MCFYITTQINQHIVPPTHTNEQYRQRKKKPPDGQHSQNLSMKREFESRTIVTEWNQIRETVVVVVVGGCWSYLETPAKKSRFNIGRNLFWCATRAEPPRLASPSLPAAFGRSIYNNSYNTFVFCHIAWSLKRDLILFHTA